MATRGTLNDTNTAQRLYAEHYVSTPDPMQALGWVADYYRDDFELLEFPPTEDLLASLAAVRAAGAEAEG